MDRELLSEMLGWTGEDIVVLAESEYDDAIVGYDTDGNVVYSYGKLVEIAMGTLGVERLEAIEYVDYNIVNSLRKERGPKVIYGTEDAGWGNVEHVISDKEYSV